MQQPFPRQTLTQLLTRCGIDDQAFQHPAVLLIAYLATILDIAFSGLFGQTYPYLSIIQVVSFYNALHFSFFLGTKTLDEMRPQRNKARSYFHLLSLSLPFLSIRCGVLIWLQSVAITSFSSLIILGLITFFCWLLFAATLKIHLREENIKNSAVRRIARIGIHTVLLLLIFYANIILI